MSRKIKRRKVNFLKYVYGRLVKQSYGRLVKQSSIEHNTINIIKNKFFEIFKIGFNFGTKTSNDAFDVMRQLNTSKQRCSNFVNEVSQDIENATKQMTSQEDYKTYNNPKEDLEAYIELPQEERRKVQESLADIDLFNPPKGWKPNQVQRGFLVMMYDLDKEEDYSEYQNKTTEQECSNFVNEVSQDIDNTSKDNTVNEQETNPKQCWYDKIKKIEELEEIAYKNKQKREQKIYERHNLNLRIVANIGIPSVANTGIPSKGKECECGYYIPSETNGYFICPSCNKMYKATPEDYGVTIENSIENENKEI